MIKATRRRKRCFDTVRILIIFMVIMILPATSGEEGRGSSSHANSKSCSAQACRMFDGELECDDRKCEVLTSKTKLTGTHGKIQSCTGCKLNHLPSLKRWMRDEQRFNDWENLDMEWIQGHNPDLVILDESGQEVERIDLSDRTYETMDTLLKQKDFAHK